MVFVVSKLIKSSSLRTETWNLKIQDGENVDVLRRPEPEVNWGRSTWNDPHDGSNISNSQTSEHIHQNDMETKNNENKKNEYKQFHSSQKLHFHLEINRQC